MRGKKILSLVLGTIVVIAGILIIGYRAGVRVHLRRTVRAVRKVEHPLYLAVMSSQPTDQFTALVESHPALVNVKAKSWDGCEPPSLLAMCADLGRTDYVRILIAHGADVNDATNYLSRYDDPRAVTLIKMCLRAGEGTAGVTHGN